MLFRQFPLLFLATTGAQALWLATADVTYYTATPGGDTFPMDYCQVANGDSSDDALSKARTVGTHGTVIGGSVSKCSQLSSQKTNQLGNFWDDYGTIYYQDDNTVWYCNTGGVGSCDAGTGAPRK